MAKCDFLYDSNAIDSVAVSSETRLCQGLIQVGSKNPSCFRKNPSNACPVAQYTRGEITLDEAQKLLDSETDNSL